MKKFFAILFIASLAFTACNKEEPTVGETTDKAVEAGKEAAADIQKKAEEATK